MDDFNEQKLNSHDHDFRLIIDILSKIKDEIHETNKKMAEYNASNELKLLKQKSEIYTTVFDRLVDHSAFLDHKKTMVEIISKLEIKVDNKVDKSSVKLIWLAITTMGGIAAFLVG